MGSSLKKGKKKIVFTNGCYDILHPGHLAVLQAAKRAGDVLFVGLNSDASVRRLKGPCRPILSQKARAEVLAAVEYVDYVVIFGQNTPQKLISVIRPDVLVKGGDWRKEEIVGADIAGEVRRVRVLPSYSTTEIVKKILRRYAQQ